MQPLVDLMLRILNFFYDAGGHNYGTAIIFLTIAVKIALYPLTLQSTQQMNAMQKLQPKLDELKKKHKNSPDKFQKETMDLYKEQGVNPLGGCLPLLLQIPVFLALFWALNSPQFKMAVAQSGAAAFLWIKNISMASNPADPTSFILPVLIAITTYYSQATMTTVSNEQTKAMAVIMPFFMAFISFNLAAGIQIYFLTQNGITVLQQMYILRNKGKV